MSDNINTIATKYCLLKKRQIQSNEFVRSLFNPQFLQKVEDVLKQQVTLSTMGSKRKICKLLGLKSKHSGILSFLIESGGILDYFIVNDDIIKMNSDFKNYQTYCFKKLEPLILSRVSRYRRFDNYDDLKQDAYEALFLALESFDPMKGSFLWWANYYINTIVSRCANTHSTIRIPIKKAKELRPHKESELPILIDNKPSPMILLSNSKIRDQINDSLAQLPPQYQDVLKMLIGLSTDPVSIKDIRIKLNLTVSQYRRIIRECKRVLVPIVRNVRSSVSIQ
jgi:RNA polymerase sigma factor (sigma-70 family)